MQAVVVVLCCLALLAIVALAVYGWKLANRIAAMAGDMAEAPTAPLDHFSDLVRLRVIVHTRDDRSIRGVLENAYSDCVVLDAPEYLGEPQVEQVAGRAVIPRTNVAWLQVLSDDGS